MIVEGALADADGARPGYARFRAGRLVEVGQLGTDSTRGRERRIRGIVLPRPVNSHTHLGDSGYHREPPFGPVSKVVGSPFAVKFRHLAQSPPEAKRAAMRASLRRMVREGVAAVVDFREEGVDGVRWLREAARSLAIEVRALGRPLARPLDPSEVDRLVEIADGIGISSAREESRATRAALARACHRRRKVFALHASEAVREAPEVYLDPRPDLLVHLTKATPDDLAEVRSAGIAAAVCPRSNALFGRRANLQGLERAGVPTLLGTDNGMFHAPSVWRELEFAYVSSRQAHRPVSTEFLFRAVFVEPWKWLGRPAAAVVAPGASARPLVLRLPPEDAYYQIVTRATEHVIVRPESAAATGDRGAA